MLDGDRRVASAVLLVCGWVLMFYVPGVQRVWSLNEGSEDSFGYAG